MSTSTIGLIIIAVLIIWDIFLAADKTDGNTWSEVLRHWGKLTLLVPWCWGGLGGHFFHWLSKPKPIIDRPGNVILLVWLSVLVAMISVIFHRFGFEQSFWLYVFFVLGSLTWMFLWPVG